MALRRSLATVGGFTLLSRLLGYIRDILIAGNFGAAIEADAFIIALRVPNLFRRAFAEGALNSAFLPLYSEHRKTGGADDARRFSAEILTVLSIAAGLTILLIEAIMPSFIQLIAPGFSRDPEKHALAVQLSRASLPSLLLISTGAVFGAVLNSQFRFAITAAAPVLFNLVLVAALALAPVLEFSISQLGWSVLLAGAGQFLWLVLAARRAGVTISYPVVPRMRRMRPFLKRLLPTLGTVGFTQVNLLVASAIASFHAGGVSYLYFAERIYLFPIGAATTAIGTVLLPHLVESNRADERERWHATLNSYLHAALLIAVPAAVALLAISEPIVRLLFERGEFTEAATRQTADVLRAFAIGIPAVVLMRTMNSALFANHDTTTPFRVSMVGVAVNLVAGYTLSRVLGVGGIALATAISSWIVVALLAQRLHALGLLRPDRQFWRRASLILLASAVMGGVLLLAEGALTAHSASSLGTVLQVSALVVAGVFTFLVMCLLTGLLAREDLRRAVRALPGRRRKTQGMDGRDE